MEPPFAIVGDGDGLVLATEPVEELRSRGPAALAALDGLASGWWAGFLSYDLGRAVERVPTIADDDLGLPDLHLVRFASRQRIDRAPEPSRALDLPGTWRSSLDPKAYHRAVGVIHGHLLAGDCYQVNLTRRLEADGAPDPLALFAAITHLHPSPHAALLHLGGVAVVSASPERFLRRDGYRIETRPIKGTAADAGVLAASAKDQAENVMIVDLARNDLGRICRYGTVEVPRLFEVEAHPGLFHLVSTVTGELRPGTGPGELIRATFPPASVTGCPKPRVLEIIESLEPVRRGVYCGAVGFIDADNDVMDLNVAIRTFTIVARRTYFGVGGGIVADSDPELEWEETELKARRLLQLR